MLQQWVVQAGRKVCVVFEGRDGAGKGGTIKAITERVSPRVFRVVALPAPTEREKSQMYVQRYVPHLPAAGEIVIFDRSWYNRAGVERVMGFCTRGAGQALPRAWCPLFEQAMVESGIILIKYWLEVSPEEQTRRLQERIDDPRKIWKLSPTWTSNPTGAGTTTRGPATRCSRRPTRTWAPWYVVRSDDKRRAQLNLIRHLLDHIPYERKSAKKVKLPARQSRGAYEAPDYPFKFIPEHDWTANER